LRNFFKFDNQAQRQLAAANGTKIQWYFQNKSAMEATKNCLKKLE